MHLWGIWWDMVWQLRPASSRLRNFLWFSVALAGLTVRTDMAGVTSIVRALGLKGAFYDNILDFFHSDGLNLDKLTKIWTKLVLKVHPDILRVNKKIVLCGDGLKVSKEGKKMPAVKLLHQESDSNTKAPYIMGHSGQVVSILAGALESFFAIPLAGRIHEGIIFSNRDKRTLLDKMILLIESLDIEERFIFVADAYYASKTIINGLIAQGNHLLTRVRSNAVAYMPVSETSGQRGRGRPKKYGSKIKLNTLFNEGAQMEEQDSPIYGEKGVKILFRSLDLLWRPVGILVRFVIVVHPHRGKIILMSTDLGLNPIEIVRLYGLRFKIELSFKQALRVVGTYGYHFWMRVMIPIKRYGGNQHVHKAGETYRESIKRKMGAYHRYIQTGIIAQGLLQIISSKVPQHVWRSFGSWLRTIRPGICPSEQVTAVAMKNCLPEFLAGSNETQIFAKFLLERIDYSRAEGARMIA